MVYDGREQPRGFAPRIVDVDDSGAPGFVERGALGRPTIRAFGVGGRLLWETELPRVKGETGYTSWVMPVGRDSAGNMHLLAGWYGESRTVYLLDDHGHIARSMRWDRMAKQATAFADVDGDGVLDVIHSDGLNGGELICRNSSGEELFRHSMPPGILINAISSVRSRNSGEVRLVLWCWRSGKDGLNTKDRLRFDATISRSDRGIELVECPAAAPFPGGTIPFQFQSGGAIHYALVVSEGLGTLYVSLWDVEGERDMIATVQGPGYGRCGQTIEPGAAAVLVRPDGEQVLLVGLGRILWAAHPAQHLSSAPTGSVPR